MNHSILRIEVKDTVLKRLCLCYGEKYVPDPHNPEG